MKNYFKILISNKILLVVICLSLSFAGISLASMKSSLQDQDSQSVVQDTLKDKLNYPSNDSLAVILYDQVPPYFEDLDPQPEQKDVPRNSAIKFTVGDTLVDDISKSGVDTSRIYITIKSRSWGVQKVRPDTIVILDPEYYFVSCVYHPRNQFDWSDTVDVYLEASDLSTRPGHNHGDTTYTFYTVRDTIAPELTPIYPLPGMIEIPIDSAITIHGTDVGRGVDLKNIKLSIKGSPVVPDTMGDPWNFEITYIPDSGWLYNDSIYVICEVQDLDGNTAILDYWFKTPTLPLPPQLISPPNGAGDQDTSLTLIWHEPDGAASYGLQVALDSLFSDQVFDRTVIEDTTQGVNGLLKETVYYWRVNATNEAGTSEWSEVWHFKTKKDSLPPLPPELISPPNGAEDQDTLLTLVWHEPEGATSYGLQIAVDSLFTDANLVVNKIGLADTLQEVSELSEGMTYYWRANANNEYGTSGWSDVWYFRTRETPKDPPLPPQLVSPEDGANNLDIPVTTVWHKSTGASTYGLQVSIDSLFAITNLVVNKTGLADTFEVVEELSKGMTYYWRVNASNEYGNSDWSEVWHFKTKMLTNLKVSQIISSAGDNPVKADSIVSLEAFISCEYSDCISSFAVCLYLIIDDNQQLINTTWLSDLKVGDVFPVKVSLRIPKEGNYIAQVFVDVFNSITELNEEDNSKKVLIRVGGAQLTVRSNPFTPNDDGINDEAEFNFKQFRVVEPNLKIFDFHGKKIVEFLGTPNDTSFTWKGLDYNGRPLLPGIYLYIFSDRDKAIARGCVVIAR